MEHALRLLLWNDFNELFKVAGETPRARGENGDPRSFLLTERRPVRGSGEEEQRPEEGISGTEAAPEPEEKGPRSVGRRERW